MGLEVLKPGASAHQEVIIIKARNISLFVKTASHSFPSFTHSLFQQMSWNQNGMDREDETNVELKDDQLIKIALLSFLLRPTIACKIYYSTDRFLHFLLLSLSRTKVERVRIQG